GGVPGALMGMVACLAWGFWQWIRVRRSARVMLSIADGMLIVRRGTARSSLTLRRLDAVRMETKTIEAAVWSYRGTRVQAPRDLARIVLVADGETIPLSDDFFSDSLTTEQFEALLSFLSSNAWSPQPEARTFTS